MVKPHCQLLQKKKYRVKMTTAQQFPLTQHVFHLGLGLRPHNLLHKYPSTQNPICGHKLLYGHMGGLRREKALFGVFGAQILLESFLGNMLHSQSLSNTSTVEISKNSFWKLHPSKNSSSSVVSILTSEVCHTFI